MNSDNWFFQLDKVKLTLNRLNDMWSFTGKPLTWEVPTLLRLEPVDRIDALSCAIRAYGCLSRCALDVELPSEWERLFKHVGQELLFTLPEKLPDRLTVDFDYVISTSFMNGWRGHTRPSP